MQTTIKTFGTATLSYESGDVCQYVLTGGKGQTVSFGNKPTEKQIRKTLQTMNKA